MSMKSLPLACFDKPTFEEDGLEFFVCNGIHGISGVRKKSDPAHTILVRDPDIALNLNMQAAKLDCGKNRFSVHTGYAGTFFFACEGKEIARQERFQPGSKTDWKRFDAYLSR